MDLISVIVPVYKVEKYLDRCVESIVNQTYKNLEIILVDDGSPDNCPAMCDEWAKRDSRIKVIHKENGGLSDARNIGMKIASGEYIAFIDSDDWIHPAYSELLHKACRDYDAKMSFCDISFVDSDNYNSMSNESLYEVPMRLYDSQAALEELLKGIGIRAVAWNKLYHRSLIDNMIFPIGKYHEDEFVIYRSIDYAHNVVSVDAKLYFYFQRTNSIMHSVSVKHLDALDAYRERLSFLKKRYPELYSHEKISFCFACAAFYCQYIKHPKEVRSQIQQKISIYRKEIHFTFNEYKTLTARQMLYVLGTGYFIDLFCHLLLLRKKGIYI